jgi:hypothetical protein
MFRAVSNETISHVAWREEPISGTADSGQPAAGLLDNPETAAEGSRVFCAPTMWRLWRERRASQAPEQEKSGAEVTSQEVSSVESVPDKSKEREEV